VFVAEQVGRGSLSSWRVEGGGRVIAALLDGWDLRLELHNGRVVVVGQLEPRSALRHAGHGSERRQWTRGTCGGRAPFMWPGISEAHVWRG
jgi:hypothetical protein